MCASSVHPRITTLHTEFRHEKKSDSVKNCVIDPTWNRCSHIERLKRPSEPVNLAYISYERKDSLGKTPLVVQHGLFGCKENWKKVSKEINLISKRSVFAVDGRNHGESPHTIDMTLPLMATDVQHFVSQIGLEKISFMGHRFDH